MVVQPSKQSFQILTMTPQGEEGLGGGDEGQGGQHSWGRHVPNRNKKLVSNPPPHTPPPPPLLSSNQYPCWMECIMSGRFFANISTQLYIAWSCFG